MILTNTNMINRIVTNGANQNVTPSQFIQHEILQFKTSRKYRDMLVGDNYFSGKHDILQKQRKAIGENGQPIQIDNLPNSKQIDNQYKKMVKQKTNYLLGKPFSIKTESETYSKLLAQSFDKKFNRLIKNIGKDSLNCGLAWLYVYYDENGQLKFKRFRPYEILPGWKDLDHTELEYVIRFYEVSVYDGKKEKKLTKIEYYNNDGVDYFEEYSGDIVACEPYHTNYFSVDETAYNWSKLPFIAFKYNDEEIPLIVNCKSLQDGLNTILSNFQDNMQEDMRNTILILVNYDGTNLGEFRRNLSAYGAVKVKSVDGTQGDVKSLQIEVNAENYKSILSIFKKAIVENCMGYDAKDDRMSGAPNQMNIQSMYNDIDLDASDMETEYQAAFEDLLWFINVHLENTGAGDFENELVEIVFNTDMPMDEASTISNIQASMGIISTETLVAKHPWVSDPTEELKKLEEEENKAKQENYLDAFNKNGNGNGGTEGEEELEN